MGFILDGHDSWGLILAGVIFIATAGIMHLLFRNRATKVTLEGGVLNVKGAMLNAKLNVSDVQAISLKTDVPYLSYGGKMFGYGGVKYLGGKYRNKEYGTYSVSVDVRDKTHIVIFHSGKCLVFNMGDAFDTQMMFNRISKECKNIKS